MESFQLSHDASYVLRSLGDLNSRQVFLSIAVCDGVGCGAYPTDSLRQIDILNVILLIAISLVPVAFAQFTAEVLINHMRETHTIMERNVDEAITLLQNNNTAEALNLLEGLDIRVKHMNSMFDDLVWELSNRGH